MLAGFFWDRVLCDLVWLLPLKGLGWQIGTSMPGSDFLFVFIVVFHVVFIIAFQVQDPFTFKIVLPYMHFKR